jgi:hypothetical protein
MALVKLTVGANGKVLVADSAATEGIKWDVPGSSTGVWTLLVKAADETISNDNTLSDDNTLFFTTVASTNYTIRGRIFWQSRTASDFKYQIAHSGTTTKFRMYTWRVGYDGGAVASPVAAFATSSASQTVATVANDDIWFLEFHLQLQVGGSGGTLSFQWAQNTAVVENTSVLEGSTLEYVTT